MASFAGRGVLKRILDPLEGLAEEDMSDRWRTGGRWFSKFVRRDRGAMADVDINDLTAADVNRERHSGSTAINSEQPWVRVQ